MSIDLTEIRHRLAGLRGREYWRSLEELAETPAFQEYLHREFPANASEWSDPVGRREFLKLMGASLALAGVTACSKQPPEHIVPYVRPPEEVIPGKPLFYATATSLQGRATGLLVESHMGRPTKIEGNPGHPASLGATDPFAQAAVLTLYDPDRSQTIKHLGEVKPWTGFLGALQTALGGQRARRGAGLRILTETVTSPTLAAQLRQLLSEFPDAGWHQYEPVNRDMARAGGLLAFNQPLEARYHIEQADVIVSLDADFLACGPGNLRYARAWAARRNVELGADRMNRLYSIESTLTSTGAVADHRVAVAPSAMVEAVHLLAHAVGVPAFDDERATASPSMPAEVRDKWIPAIADDLKRHRRRSLVIPGDYQSPQVHALAHVMNAALGNIGTTVEYTDPVEAQPVDQTDSLRQLVQQMNGGLVELLVIIGGNPVFTAPRDLRVADALSRVALRIHLSLYEDETSEHCHWHVPEAHFLEIWSDARAYDGTVSIIQPLISPLYSGKSSHELLTAFSSQPERTSLELVRSFWQRTYSELGFGSFEEFWRQALHDGVIAGTTFQSKAVTPNRPEGKLVTRGLVVPGASLPKTTQGDTIEIVFRPDPSVFDGRLANNGWLQELPRPLTKLTWDNAALVSPETADRRGLKNEDVVELEYQGAKVRAPVWIAFGHPNDCVTVHLGYGRRRAGRVGTGVGFDAYALRTSAAPWFASGGILRKTGDHHQLVSTQGHHSMEGRHLVRSASVEEFQKHPEFAQHMEHEPPPTLTMYPPFEYEGYAWGMAIDLNVCTGCNACVAACQSENNIPIVGKDQVGRGREMHWLRVDTYYSGDPQTPEVAHQPVPCMHCENAPCEVVCPVAATAHSAEGLNDMVYNRCVGTRYCSNNCPYKVRRFNFLQYSDYTTPVLKLSRNPDVTVRTRGVMEKCTYCVQRINSARSDARRENRLIRDGEIKTACQAVCPTEAITFGNVNDRNSVVAQLKASQRNYHLLAHLNTRPRTSYLAVVKNPNPELTNGE